MKCWICQKNEANSGEHSIKKSDLKSLYPTASQSQPIYQRKDGEIKRPIGSIKAQDFKYENVICEKCNNSLTQKSDLSWETLSKYLSSNWSNIVKDNGFEISAVFPEETQKNLINVQLFFVKLMGCKIKESKGTFDLKGFREAITEDREHQDIYFSIRSSANKKTGNYSVNSDIQLSTGPNQEIHYAHWFYVLGEFAIDVIYSDKVKDIDLNGALKPSQIKGFITLSSLNYDQTYNKS